MTPNRDIILAFWRYSQQRFVELTGDEIKARLGFSPHDWQMTGAVSDGYVKSELLGKKGILIYSLTNRGKAAAKAFIDQPGAAQPRRLTAQPVENAK